MIAHTDAFSLSFNMAFC